MTKLMQWCMEVYVLFIDRFDESGRVVCLFDFVQSISRSLRVVIVIFTKIFEFLLVLSI